MLRNSWERLALFSYGELETLIARFYGASAKAQVGALRGRIRHLRRLGLPIGVAPGGSGRKIAYGKEQVYELGFCLQLEQLGIDPSLAVDLLKAHGHRKYILRAYGEAEEALQKGELYFFWLVTEFMSAGWSTKKLKFPGLPVFQAGSLEEFEDAIARFDSRQGGCMALFHMTTLVREVLEAAKAQE
jgi:hypothetical protein